MAFVPTFPSCAVCFCLGVTIVGCHTRGVETRVLYGVVACGGERVPAGRVRFVPIGNTPGPASHSHIVDGHYRITSRGGVPLGQHRVEIDAYRMTGRHVRGYDGLEEAQVEEKVPVVPPEYAGDSSPLIVEVTADSKLPLDFDLPAQ